jgi:hypothetical protein
LRLFFFEFPLSKRSFADCEAIMAVLRMEEVLGVVAEAVEAELAPIFAQLIGMLFCLLSQPLRRIFTLNTPILPACARFYFPLFLFECFLLKISCSL